MEELFGRIFREDFFGRNFLGGYLWKEFFERNYLVEINKELMFLSRFLDNFVSIQGRRILILRSVRRKLIALKKQRK